MKALLLDRLGENVKLPRWLAASFRLESRGWLKEYKSGFEKAKEIAAANGIEQGLVECAWGDALGAIFYGLSVPGDSSGKQKQELEEDFARWRWLADDPVFERVAEALGIHRKVSALRRVEPATGSLRAEGTMAGGLDSHR